MSQTTEALHPQLAHEISVLEGQAVDAMQRGNDAEATEIWRRVVALHPGHVRAHTQLGQNSFKRGDFQSAKQSFLRVTELDGRETRQWVNVALAARSLQEEAQEEAAIFQALKVDPYDLLALILRGGLYERQGRIHEAAKAYGAAVTVAPPPDRIAPDLHNAVLYAAQFQENHQQKFAEFLDGYLQPHLAGHKVAETARFKDAVDILLGRKRRYESSPMQFFVPGLAPVEFFDRSHFPWMEALEAGTADIREEFQAVMQSEQPQFVPYIRYGEDQPVAQWRELNESPRWTAFHLMKDGLAVPENTARCPKTMALWSQVPSPDQPGRTPVAMYSLLQPKTRIPPHVGASNARLVAHLPLIVPPNCGFRVGNTTRTWEPGRAWVFDDTIEHEAWNESDALRVVFIFDVWHPNLNPEERHLIGLLSNALNAFNTGMPSGYGA